MLKLFILKGNSVKENVTGREMHTVLKYTLE